ncbi:CAP domain-containing protein [Actinoplanes sp. URMC 104]|uniref:CAP domain-containing protein n=1 Tax=Actinoplanes sp. URMC 104 TaxID=3423409 RepID=UPI003F1CBA79
MTRTIRRAAIAAALIAAPMIVFAGPALAASAAQPTEAGVISDSDHPHGRQYQPGDGWSRKPAPRFTRPAYPVASRPTSSPVPGTSTKPAAPTATPVPASSPVASDDIETQVVTLTNAERIKNGCGALRIDSRLVAAARAHSTDMVTNTFFDHTGSDGSTFVVREARAGYTTGASAENIAWGYRTPQAVVTGWMNSAGHRANILNCSSVAVGVGVAYAADGSLYWTQNFGRI